MLKPLTIAVGLALFAGCVTTKEMNPVEQNRAGLDQLDVNMTRENVHVVMGSHPEEADGTPRAGVRPPHRVENYQTGAYQWEVLYYQTEATEAGEEPGDEHLTPVVLLDGLLVGWGWGFWRDAAAKNNIALPGGP